MKRLISTLGFMTAFVVGCTKPAVPPAAVTSAEVSVQTAREAGANRDPQAKQHLTMAQNQVDEAKQIIKAKGDPGEAYALLTRAKSDAALAAALTREADEKAKAAAPIQPEQPQR
jgi:hypothetical protein